MRGMYVYETNIVKIFSY